MSEKADPSSSTLGPVLVHTSFTRFVFSSKNFGWLAFGRELLAFCAHPLCPMAPMFVVKRNGEKQEVKFDAITRRIRNLCEGLDPRFVDPVPVTQKVVEGFYHGISTSEIDILAAETCAYMSQKHPDFSTLAARIAVSNLHKNTSDSFHETCKVLHGYVDAQGRPAALLAEDVFEFVQANAEALDSAIVYQRDLNYDYFGFKTLEKSYLLRVHGKIVERPQHMIMRAACGIHTGDLKAALETQPGRRGWHTNSIDPKDLTDEGQRHRIL